MGKVPSEVWLEEGGVRDGGNRGWAEVEREAFARSGGVGGSGVALGILQVLVLPSCPLP